LYTKTANYAENKMQAEVANSFSIARVGYIAPFRKVKHTAKILRKCNLNIIFLST